MHIGQSAHTLLQFIAWRCAAGGIVRPLNPF